MHDDKARQLMKEVMGEVAPEADFDAVPPDEPLQEAFDLDSIDFLNFVTGLHERTGLEIPERDCPELATVGGCVRYLAAAA